MAIKKKGGDESAAQEPTETVDSAKAAKGARSSASTQRKPLTIAAIVGGGVLALGAAFGIGLAAGHASPGFPGGAEFAAGAMHVGGHGDRDGGRDSDHRDGPKGPRGPESGARGGMGQPGEADFCHPGDGHTHDASGNDVAPSDAAEGFTCQTGPAGGMGEITPAPAPSTTP
ncbi:MAG: hypothetical protein RLZZ587_461 [Actinomycetota bacterium]